MVVKLLIANSYIGLFLLLLTFNSNAQRPAFYWTFEGEDSLLDIVQKQRLDITSYKTKVERTEGIAGLSIKPASSGSLLVTNLFKRTPGIQEFTLEFAFKGRQFSFASFPSPEFRLNFSYQGINVGYTVQRGGKVINERWDFPLNGTEVASYNNLADDGWHHFVFIGRRSGKFEIWIDGSRDSLFTKKALPFEKWVVTGGDAFKTNSAIDELAFYSKALSPELIQQHALELKNGTHYTFEVSRSVIRQLSRIAKKSEPEIDKKEFAPGYPDYNVQATDQLMQFPLPRYADNVKLPRNFSWMDITYLHRELLTNGGAGFGRVSPKKAVQLTEELARNWNYYIELPTLRVDAVTAAEKYSNPSEIYSPLIDFANKNRDLPAATILIQVQNKPLHAGFDRNSSYVTAQDLSDKYYLCNEKGVPILYNNRKWLNPFTSVSMVQRDGLTSAFYLKQLTKRLSRKLDMINENGEWFGHQWSENLLRQSPDVKGFMKNTGRDYFKINGWMQNRFDSVYKAAILRSLPWKDVKFTFYNVSASNSAYWPEYSERIETNSFFKGAPRSTPSFYPSRPDNWRLASGPLNGYGAIAEGRKQEIALGVKHFAPFVSAGWNIEELNIRPAQWLGLLKAMVMLGADFFHTGYFNVTGQTGWPNGVGPNDPRGYIYQAAMPSYAQAIASHAWELLDKGILLEDSLSKELRMPFAFTASAPNHLVLVRKFGKKYLIYGTVQPSSNYVNNAVVEAETSIVLDGMKLRFNIRRQGSMYVLDRSDSLPVFYQLDGWHQYEHPYYWSDNFKVEVENFENTEQRIKIITNQISSSFVDFTTYVRLAQKDTLRYVVKGRNNALNKLAVRCRRVEGTPKIIVQSGNFQKTVKVSKNSWGSLLVNVRESTGRAKNEWRITVTGGIVDLDFLEWIGN